jgi:hypothetical protein
MAQGECVGGKYYRIFLLVLPQVLYLTYAIN